MARLGRAILFAKDLARMVAFYRSALQLPVVSDDPGFVVLGESGMELALHEIPARFARDIEIADPPVPRSKTPVKLVFAVADLDDARDRFAAAGGIIGEPWSIGDRRLADGTDPEGNVIQLTE